MNENQEAIEEYNAWRREQGYKPIEEAPRVPAGVRTPKRAHFLNLTDECWEGLKIVAYEQGFTSVTQLIEALGTRKWPE